MPSPAEAKQKKKDKKEKKDKKDKTKKDKKEKKKDESRDDGDDDDDGEGAAGSDRRYVVVDDQPLQLEQVLVGRVYIYLPKGNESDPATVHGGQYQS